MTYSLPLKEEFIIGLEVTGLQFTRRQDIFVAFLLEAKLLIHQLINYGMNYGRIVMEE